MDNKFAQSSSSDTLNKERASYVKFMSRTSYIF